MTLALDFAGNDLIVNTLTLGATSAGQAVTGSTVAPLAIASGSTLKSNVAATTFTSNVATGTSYFVQATTPSLTTAAAASQTEVYTLTGVAATDIAFVTAAGGTNTRKNYTLEAVCTTNTVTVTITNTEPTNALNGTIIFNLMVLKA